MSRPRILLLAALAALVWTGSAYGFTKEDGTATMDDAAVLTTTLYLPDGAPPAQGWPGILMLHGLGGSRQDTNALAETFFVNQGYAVLTYDVRGHGGSGGLVTVAGPRELADVRALFAAFAARPDVDDAHIGGWGISYGGGQVWTAAAQGLPFAAIETVETWTDLYGALFPQNLAKSGVVGGFLQEIPAGRLDPAFAFLQTEAIASIGLDRVRLLGAERSALPLVSQIRAPVLMLQGRRDFAFGLEQAIQAFQRLTVPKHLYIGDHGHAPSKFPAADTQYSMTEAREWFDRWLKGLPNGIESRPPVELAPDPWTGTPVSYPGLPPTTSVSFKAPGKATISNSGIVNRSLGKTTAPLEVFGSAAVTVAVNATAGWPRVVAVLTAVTPTKKKIVVSGGGVPATAGSRTVTIRLIDDATFVPKGSQLTLSIGSNTSKTPAGLLYLDLPTPAGVKLTVGNATVKLPVLKTPVSK